MKIIKLPENLFFGIGITTSIFIFTAGKAQDDREIFAVNIEDDGLVTVKNKGRHDVRGTWPELEDYWVKAVERSADPRFDTGQWLKPSEHLSWQTPAKPFVLTEEDLARTAMDYAMYQRGIDSKTLHERLGQMALYSARVQTTDTTMTLEVDR